MIPSVEEAKLYGKIHQLEALNTELLAALEKIVDLAHYPDESIARAAIAKANDGGING